MLIELPSIIYLYNTEYLNINSSSVLRIKYDWILLNLKWIKSRHIIFK